MNAFENIVAQYLEAEGYWVRQSVKVEISKEDKKRIGTPTMPTPEIDIVALNVKNNELLLIEVKSLLDSYGVWYETVAGKDEKKYTRRYKLFTHGVFRDIVTKRIHEQYLRQGLINTKTKFNYALAAGNIHSEADEVKLAKHFSKKGWKLFSPRMIKEKMRELSERGWEDNEITITAKLLLRQDD
jgi:Holliday junction resolvase-like predicted endonuclease